MKSLARPVGPASPGTYWRRRVLVVTLAVLVAYGIARACSPDPSDSDPASTSRQLQDGQQPTAADGTAPDDPAPSDGGEEPPGSEPTEKSQSTAEATQASGGGGGVRPGYCLDENVRLDVRPSKRQYLPGEKPRFVILFVNVGDAPCRFEVGPAGWRIDIMTGETQVWSSDDCATDEASEPQTLDRLTPVPIDIDWDRLRSDPACPSGERPAAELGTYTVTARAADVVSPKAVFILAPDEE